MSKSNADQSKLFRKAALNRLSSPEELDVVMKIIHPRTWIATTAIGVSLLAVVIWSVVGTIPTTVRAQGILIKTGGLFEIVAPASGPVAEFLLSEGDSVEAGQLVARLEQPELEINLENERQTLEDLQAQYQDRSITTRTNLDFETETLALQQEAFRLERNTLESAIAFSGQRLASLAEQLRNEEALLARGLITNRTVLQTRQEYYVTSDGLGTNFSVWRYPGSRRCPRDTVVRVSRSKTLRVAAWRLVHRNGSYDSSKNGSCSRPKSGA